MSRITLNTNLAALSAQRRLGQATSALSKSYTRVSSGLRINRAADDAAGLAIASHLNAELRISRQAGHNISDGISALSIAEGALNELSVISIRLSELAEQSANGVYTLDQRRALDSEANALVNEHNRIVESTEFNGERLFASGTKTLGIQAGSDGSGKSQISISFGNELSTGVGTGTFQAFSTFSGAYQGAWSPIAVDFTGDGLADLVVRDTMYVGNGDGTFRAGTLVSSKPISISADINSDGKLDLFSYGTSTIYTSLGNGDGTFKAALSIAALGNPLYSPHNIKTGDFNNDGLLDFACLTDTSETLGMYFGYGDGTFQAGITVSSINTNGAGTGGHYGLAVFDSNGDGLDDIVAERVIVGLGYFYQSFISNGDGTFNQVASVSVGSENAYKAIDLNHDGYIDLLSSRNDGFGVKLGNGDGTFKRTVTYTALESISAALDIADLNGDGYTDVVLANWYHPVDYGIAVLFGNGDGSFGGQTRLFSGQTTSGVTLCDLDNNGAWDIVAGSFTSTPIRIALGDSTESSRLNLIDILSPKNARDALGELSVLRQRIVRELGSLGAEQSRLQTAHFLTGAVRENLAAAESQIIDADLATESAQLVRKRILQQMGAAILAQANQSPQIALTLLGGI